VTDATGVAKPSAPPAALPDPGDNVIAAVDLGSNSFHMVVATLRHGQLTVIDRLRESVRLAEGLDTHAGLSPASRERALDCLRRFGERLRSMHAGRVRAAGTNTLRRVRGDGRFLAEAEAALGHPIDVISGVEEARLIYLGVAHSLPPESGRRLVIDIGGGSTELIVGQGLQAEALESLGMGCVVMTERYFPGGVLTRECFDAARVAARLKLRPVKARFRGSNWQQAIGASGTIRATIAVVREAGKPGFDDSITPADVEGLIERMIEAGHVDKLDLPGLPDGRAPVWAGGLAILAEVMTGLRIEKLYESEGSMREGVMYDLVGRLAHNDARVRSVRALADRYHVDTDQAGRVSKTAAILYDQLADDVAFDDELGGLSLEWASLLHEIGLDIAHANFHEHGAYVVGHADMPGFPRSEQKLLAFLIANQRKRPSDDRLRALPKRWRKPAKILAILLRLAVLINRNRSDAALPEMRIAVAKKGVMIEFPSAWLADNPLTVADLEREQRYLVEWGITLEVTAS
jgi:exopolyphosphatase/guanosine-5'-triphosphate,3'-diphosphate pyrophosphatase